MSIIYDMPFADYQKAEGVNCSAFKNLVKSPLHMQNYLTAPLKQTPSMLFGRIVHDLVLEPAKKPFWDVMPDGLDGRTKAGKDWKAGITLAGLEPITGEVYETAQGCVRSVLGHPYMREALANCKTEVSIFSERDGIKIKGRLDVVCNNGLLFDLKTTTDARPESFQRDFFKLGYYLQAKWYVDLYNAERGDLPEATRFGICAVESDAPYAVQLYSVDDEALSRASLDISQLWAIYKGCLERNEWPGYDRSILPLGVPKWMK